MKNKKIIGICIICIFVISIIIIFLKTDLLKTNEMLFWKYIWKEKEQVEQIISKKEIKDFENNVEKSVYTKEEEITIKSKYNLIKPININIKEIGDNLQNRKNTQISTIYNKKNIADMNIITDNDYILFKCEKLYNKYIGFENNNLKQLAKRIGITNTKLIPNKLQGINYNELFRITDQQKRHFIEYISIFRKHIKNKNYLKEINTQKSQEDDGTENIYTLNICKRDFNELIVDILNKTHDDYIILDYLCSKVKIIDDGNEFSDINKMREKIETIIDYLEKSDESDKSEEQFLTVKIYTNNNDVTMLEFMIKNNRTISVTTDNSENKIIIKQYDVEDNNINISDIDGVINTLLNNISEINYTKSVENERKCNIEIGVICKIGIEEMKLEYECTQEIKDDLEHIDSKNEVDYTELDESIYKKILSNIMLQYTEL